jgi:hypothetical protein
MAVVLYTLATTEATESDAKAMLRALIHHDHSREIHT